MRLGWRIPLPGPFYLGGTIWRSRRRGPLRETYSGYITDDRGKRIWTCPHRHSRPDLAENCSHRELTRRQGTPR